MRLIYLELRLATVFSKKNALKKTATWRGMRCTLLFLFLSSVFGCCFVLYLHGSGGELISVLKYVVFSAIATHSHFYIAFQ